MPESDYRKAQKRQYERENYWFFKKIGICVECGKERAFNGRVYCSECLYIRNERKRNKPITDESRKHDREYKKRKYYDHKEKGLCVNCNRKAIEGSVLCNECRIRHRRSDAKGRIKSGKNKQLDIQNLCIRCGSKRLEGKKMCQNCLDKARESMDYARSFLKGEENVH